MTASRIVRRPIFITNTQKEITKTNKKEDEGNRNILYKRRKKKRKKRKKERRSHWTVEKAKNLKTEKKEKNRETKKTERLSHICTDEINLYAIDRVAFMRENAEKNVVWCERPNVQESRGSFSICADFPRSFRNRSPFFMIQPKNKNYSRVTRCRVKVRKNRERVCKCETCLKKQKKKKKGNNCCVKFS